jgi:hypothetical protein
VLIFTNKYNCRSYFVDVGAGQLGDRSLEVPHQVHHLLLALFAGDVYQGLRAVLDAFLDLSLDCPLVVLESFLEPLQLALLPLVLVNFSLESRHHLNLFLFDFIDICSQLPQLLLGFLLVLLHSLELVVFSL